MSRRSVPRIAPEDLRDHADEARVARVWDRVEHDLVGFEAPRARSPRVLYFAAAAAAFVAFGGGVLTGRVAFEDRGPVPVAAATASDASTDDVLAAGTQGRTFALPGGGQLKLAPGATVELDRGAGGALTLKLVQGEASVDTAGAARASALAIVAGEARLDTQAGSVVSVRRAEDALDVSVRDGAVRLTAPDGARSLGRGERASAVPTRSVIAVVPPSDTSAANALPPRRWSGVASAKSAKKGEPEWRARHDAGLHEEAFALLKKQSGGVDAAIHNARSAEELMAIRDIARIGGDPQSAIAAATRVVDNFPDDQRASAAAFDLAGMYEKSGQAALAEKYFRFARAFKPTDAIAESAFCGHIRAAVAAGHNDEASRVASEYVARYPNGRCKEEAQHALEGAGESGSPAPGAAASAAPNAVPNAAGDEPRDKPAAPAPAPTVAP